MKTTQCKNCNSIYLPVTWIPYKDKFCSEECRDEYGKEQVRIKKWRKRLDDKFIPGRVK